MSRTASGRGKSASSGGVSSQAWVRELQAYFWRSELPLTALIFLLPMIVLYEVGTAHYAYDWRQQAETRVLAFSMVRQFLEWFGATGKYLPGLAVVGILVAWHFARRDPWKLHVGTALLMTVESALLALPLLVVGSLVGQYLPLFAGAATGGFVLALGAGIYEELVFRLISFTLIHVILVDLLRVDRRPAYLLMVVGSAVLFSAYHYWSPYSSPFRLSDFVFRTLSGIYFGILFLSRGFGVTAGTHAAYDIYYFALRAMAHP